MCLFVREDVAALFLAVVRVMLLDSIIGQVNRQVLLLLQSVRVARHPYIAFSEQVASMLMGDHNPQSHIEFALIYQHGQLDVLLDHHYVCSEHTCQRFSLFSCGGGLISDDGFMNDFDALCIVGN